MKIKITAESTIDLTKELLEEYKISTLPFTVILGDNEYKDGEITSKDIFEFVEENKTLPKTAAINEEQYTEFFTEMKKENDAIVHICLSSKISCAHQNAVAAASKFENVYVVDSKSLSTGIALLAIYASKLASEGVLSAKEIFEKVSARVPSVQASFVIKKLDYLYKGGRCSALALVGSKFLKIRPQILLENGAMGVHKKYMGKMEGAIAKYVDDCIEEFNNPDLSVAFVTYTTATEGMIESAKAALKARGFEKIYETTAGATITSHCGENTLGILYLNDGGNK